MIYILTQQETGGLNINVNMNDHLVKIGHIALDDNTYILPGSYKCFPVAKGEQWEDAAGGNHDDVYARKIEGSFTLNALSQEELDFFMNAYRLAKIYPDANDRRIMITVFVPTENAYRTLQVIAEMPEMSVWFIHKQAYYKDAEFRFKEC